jgi:hypothetical protein
MFWNQRSRYLCANDDRKRSKVIDDQRGLVGHERAVVPILVANQMNQALYKAEWQTSLQVTYNKDRRG